MIRIKKEKLALAGALALTAGIFALGSPITAQAATGTVTSSNVKVRAEASTSSEQVSSLDSGDKVDIIDEATDSQGYVWYRIYVNGTEYGYVRSDLVSKSGDTSSSSTSTSTETKKELPKTEVTAVDQQSATVTVASANVRSGAGTAYETVGTVKNGDTVTITGEANGTDNKKWYEVSFGSNGRTGFVRADLVQIGAAAPAENTESAEGEGETAEGAEGEAVEGAVEGAEGEEAQPQEEAPAEEPKNETDKIGNGEYSLAYKDDGSGTEVWYLYDNVDGTQVKLNDLLSFAAAGQQTDKLKDQIGKFKVVMIIMAVIIALLVLAVLLLIYRLRDYAYYEEGDESETRPRKNDDHKEVSPSKNYKSASRESKTVEPARSSGRTVADSKRPERPEHAEKPERTVSPTRDRKAAPMGTAASLLDDEPVRKSSGGRKPKNFLLEDDDFEFEFLDLDDEDK